jgi:uncharacterized membrane protein YfcA
MLLLFILLIVAAIYAAVGHGGASGYLAILLLAGFAPESLRPLVLMMNVIVTSYLLFRSQLSAWREQSFFPVLMMASIPAAFLGGSLQLDDSVYRFILGVLLIISTLRLFSSKQDVIQTIKPKITPVISVGALLGFMAGLTGIGGGVLLSPLLILFRWSNVRQSIPIVAAFILINSLSGLAGWLFSGRQLVTVDQSFLIQSLCIAFFGAILGSLWSKKYASNKSLRYVLVVVLLIAGAKMIASAVS